MGEVVIGNTRLIPSGLDLPETTDLEAQGKTLLFVERDGKLVGLLAASDTVRPEVQYALTLVSAYCIKHIEILTGDNEHVASSLAA